MKMVENGEMAPEKRAEGYLCRNCEVGTACRLCFSDRAGGIVKSARLADFNRKTEKKYKFQGFWLGF